MRHAVQTKSRRRHALSDGLKTRRGRLKTVKTFRRKPSPQTEQKDRHVRHPPNHRRRRHRPRAWRRGRYPHFRQTPAAAGAADQRRQNPAAAPCPLHRFLRRRETHHRQRPDALFRRARQLYRRGCHRTARPRRAGGHADAAVALFGIGRAPCRAGRIHQTRLSQ